MQTAEQEKLQRELSLTAGASDSVAKESSEAEEIGKLDESNRRYFFPHRSQSWFFCVYRQMLSTPGVLVEPSRRYIYQ